jgi:hypothetical protein
LSKKKVSSDAAFLTIKQSLSCLSPLPCQVKEHKPDNPAVVPSSNKPQVTSSDTSDISPTILAITLNRIAARWRTKIKQLCTKQQYIIGVDNKELQQGILDGTIATTVADSGATSGVGTTANPCPRLGRPSNKRFILPSGNVIPATKMAEYPLNVRAPANKLHITPGVSQHSLLSTGKFANANYITVFDKEMVNVYNANNTIFTVSRGAILHGFCDPVLNLYQIPLVDMVRNNNTNTIIVDCPPTEYLSNQPPPSKAVYNVYELETQPELVQYHHASAGFPTKPTWLAAIKNKHFTSWPGLTLDAARKHFPNSKETHKGHGKKTPSSLRSTKTKQGPLFDNCDDAFGDEQEAQLPLRPVKKEKTISYRILDWADEATKKNWSDQPGRFPKKSSKGNQYIMVLTESDSDVILVETMKNCSSGEMIWAYQKLIDRLHATAIVPKHHILDNKCSDEFKETIKCNKMTYQLVPPHNHHHNHTKKAIQTFKDHFVAILCRAGKEFPLNLWDLLLPQAENTLTMLCPSRMTPTVSAYTYLWGQHDYNSNPFVPLGCKVEALYHV